jgi:hypothetical protein
MKKFMTFIDKYMPGANISDANLVYGYAAAQTMVQQKRRVGKGVLAPCPPSTTAVCGTNGRHVIGRAFARPAGFAHPTDCALFRCSS